MAGQVWGTSSLGGYMYSLNLSKELRISLRPIVKFRQFADVKDAAHQGLSKGDTFHWNVYSTVAAGGGTLTEGTAIGETNFTITQGTMSIAEWGNSLPFTSKLDDLSEQPVKEIIHKVLKIDAAQALDDMIADQIDATPLRVVPAGPTAGGTSTDSVVLTTNGVSTTTNDVALGKDHVKAIVDVMKERNIPSYENDDYFCLAWPTTFRTLKNNLESISQYVESGFQMIRNGETGRYEGVRFVEQTYRAKGGSGDGMGTAAAAWSKGKSDWAVFFGADTVAEAVAIPEEIRGKIPTDYGRSRGIAWYYLGGAGLVHSTAAQARVVLWDSAA
jgi:N4-gp56 family major capsid protein